MLVHGNTPPNASPGNFFAVHYTVLAFLFVICVPDTVESQHMIRLKPDQNRNAPSETGQQSATFDSTNIPASSAITLSMLRGDSTQETYTLEKHDEVRIIVQFAGNPISSVGNMRTGFPTQAARSVLMALQGEHAQFHSDIVNLDAAYSSSHPSQSGLPETQILAEYRTAFNGVALITSRYIARQLQELPYILNVWEDRRVEAFDDTSNAIVGAPTFWVETGMHGEDVDIGIIDTGIDYIHEALGGAAFPNTKVVGGYDIVNDDTDPMDDAGHGTHVAGIAAGEDTGAAQFRGIAYKARLWAFKVLNENGWGWNSWVMSGIERSLDPDGDPETPTPIDVINLSLGGIGDPDDPMSRMIDNATAGGMICVVAAGNHGSSHGGIYSPGTARTAITVGATADDNTIADFSSRGATPDPWIIKPDVVAPGVSILSAQSGGGYIAMNGTSMAAPHVAGAAALLRQLHPQWPPEQIKALMMQTATPVHHDIFTQGAGLLTLPPIPSWNVIMTPPTLDLGIDDATDDEWNHSTSVTIHNHGSFPVIYSLSEQLPGPPGVNLTFNPSELTIPAGESSRVEVTFTVDHTIVPYGQDTPGWEYYQPTRWGSVLAQSSGPSLGVPFAFVRAHMLRIVMDETPWYFVIEDQPPFMSTYYEVWWAYTPSVNDTLNFLHPRQDLDIIGCYDDYQTKIVKENIHVDGVTFVDFRKEDAKNMITVNRHDHLGQPIPFSGPGWIAAMVHSGGHATSTGEGFIGPGQPASTLDTAYFPDVSSRWRYEIAFSTNHNGNYYGLPFATDWGFNSSLSLENNPADFREVDFKFLPRDGASTVEFRPNLIRSWRDIYLPFATLSDPFTIKGFLAPFPASDAGVSLYPFVYGYHTALLSLTNPDRLDVSNHWWRFADSTFPFTYKVGYGAPYWGGECLNQPNAIRLVEGTFVTLLWDRGYGEQLLYRLWHNGTWVAWGNDLSAFFTYTNVMPGSYVLEFEFTKYMILDLWGKATTRLEFDLVRPDPNPPRTTGFGIFSNGDYTDEIYVGHPTEVWFDAVDSGPIVSAEFWYKAGGSWISVPLSQTGQRYFASLPVDLPEGYLSVRFRLVDSSGNAIDQKIEPAFFSHRILPSMPTLSYPPPDSIEMPTTVKFEWDRSFAANKYHLQIGLDSGFLSTIHDDSTIKTNSKRVGPLPGLTSFYWRVRSLNPVGASDYSASRRFTTADTMSTVAIRKGWNLVSASLGLAHPERAAAYPGSITTLYAFNGISYVAQETLRVGTGYWIKFPADDTLYLAGFNVPADTISLFPDWNLIGSVSVPVPVSSITSDPPGMTTSTFYDYDGSFLPADTIRPGKGYWVKADQPGALILTTNQPFALTAVAGLRIIQSSELPPPPPGSAGSETSVPLHAYSLNPNYPNPFNSSTTIQFSLANAGLVFLSVYNILGQEVKTLVDGVLPRGDYSVQYSAGDLPSGIYFYTLTAGTYTRVRKMVLMK